MDETKFDMYMERHFTKEILSNLEKTVLELIPEKHAVLFKQSMIVLDENSFALSNLGFIAIIDDLTSFFLKNKGCTSRYSLFKPIVDDIENLELDEFGPKHFLLMMVDSNLNTLYKNQNFDEEIVIETHKDINRHTSIHGKYFSNIKSSSLMLANTIYNLLIVNNEFASYRDSIVKKIRQMYLLNYMLICFLILYIQK